MTDHHKTTVVSMRTDDEYDMRVDRRSPWGTNDTAGENRDEYAKYVDVLEKAAEAYQAEEVREAWQLCRQAAQIAYRVAGRFNDRAHDKFKAAGDRVPGERYLEAVTMSVRWHHRWNFARACRDVVNAKRDEVHGGGPRD